MQYTEDQNPIQETQLPQAEEVTPVSAPVKRERKTAAAKEENTALALLPDVYEHGFKIPLQLHPQHAACDTISFRKGNVEYRLKPTDILSLARIGAIVPGASVGKLPWSAAIGLFVNNLDGGRNKTFHDIIENSKQKTFSDNLK